MKYKAIYMSYFRFVENKDDKGQSNLIKTAQNIC